MRVAITGASGFVGRHVLRELQSRDLDIVITSRSPKHEHEQGPKTEVVQMNIAHGSPDPYESLRRPDVLIHLAWDGLPNYQSPAHIETELPTQLRFLRTCLASGLKRLVVTGTCFEYGKTQGKICEDSPSQPCTRYGEAKDTLRKQLEAIQSKHPFQLAWLRLFYLYGEAQSKSSLYSSLAAAMLRGDAKFDMSGGDQVRDFLPIQAAARVIADLALLPADIGIVNVCSGIPTTVREQVEEWIKGKNSKIRMNLGQMSYSEFEPMSFWGDRTKLDKLLGAM